MKEIIKSLIDYAVDGYEWIYDPQNGSLWLINPDTKQWLLEYENSGDLWYNWSRWTDFFKYIDMEYFEYQQYLTSYVEDVLQNGVRNTGDQYGQYFFLVEDVLQNGVRNTSETLDNQHLFVEDVLQNGVRNTMESPDVGFYMVEDVLQNGVRNIG